MSPATPACPQRRTSPAERLQGPRVGACFLGQGRLWLCPGKCVPHQPRVAFHIPQSNFVQGPGHTLLPLRWARLPLWPSQGARKGSDSGEDPSPLTGVSQAAAPGSLPLPLPGDLLLCDLGASVVPARWASADPSCGREVWASITLLVPATSFVPGAEGCTEVEGLNLNSQPPIAMTKWCL